MRFRYIGIYNGERYELQGGGITSVTGEFISFYHDTDYNAIGAARKIQKWVLVPDGSPFNHYFDAVEIYADDQKIAKVRGKDLYRYSLFGFVP